MSLLDVNLFRRICQSNYGYVSSTTCIQQSVRNNIYGYITVGHNISLSESLTLAEVRSATNLLYIGKCPGI